MLRYALVMLVACSKPPHDASPIPGEGEAGVDPGGPPPAGIGGHALAFDPFASQHAPMISTPAFATSASGSTMIVGIGRGTAAVFDAAGRAPTDNLGNTPYQLIGAEEHYEAYPQSSAAIYAFPSMTGGAKTIVSTMVPMTDEITIAAVEVVGGTKVSAAWNEVGSDAPQTSQSITTTGPATLVAFWWGEDDKAMRTAVPDGGFVVIDSVLTAGELVECAVAAKSVTAAGTYNVTWAATPAQAAMLWLVAVQ
jgi:hypothetical protein